MSINQDYLLCSNLLTRPRPELGTVLVTGATGYVGGRLVPELLARGYRVKVMARVSDDECRARWPEAETVVADALNPDQLLDAFSGVHTVYYLIHALLLGPKHFEAADIRAAINAREAAGKAGVSRIIYLGALGDTKKVLSPHLRSRTQVAEELRKGQFSTTVLRAAMIIGSGSASYEILSNICRKAPIMLIPWWAVTRCQPISIRSLISILVGVLETEETAGKTYDIGDAEILSYERMIRAFSRILGKRKLLIRSSFSSVPLYSYIASFLTPVPAAIIRSLLEGCCDQVVCKDNEVLAITRYRPMMFEEAVRRAIAREKGDSVHSRWSDEHPRAHELATRLHELEIPPDFVSSYSLLSDKDGADLYRSFCRIGGKDGWFNGNWMWRFRGTLDRLLMGVGHSRGRRSFSNLRVNDVVGFWRVENIVDNRRLLLRAEMKLPGKAWLEFVTRQDKERTRLIVTAYYVPGGWRGRIYWYNFLPFHHFIFTDLLKQIERRG